MGRPQGNGIVEMVDEKSSDRGFFCMQLVGYIMEEHKEQMTLDSQDLYLLRFSEAKDGNCSYRDVCPIYARTIAKHGKKPVQLSIDFGI